MPGAVDRLAGLRRIGIDEISYRKGQRYLLVVTCLLYTSDAADE